MQDLVSDLPQLLCSICEHSLSRFPIYAYEDNSSYRFICGRCPLKTGVKLHRQIAYESSVQDIIFPCHYKANGCRLKLSPEDLREHESCCTHKLHFCPTLPEGMCSWRGKYLKVQEHYKQQHEKLLFDAGNKSKLDLTQNLEDNWLALEEEEFFLVHLRYQEPVFSYQVSYPVQETIAKNYTCKMILTVGEDVFEFPKVSVNSGNVKADDNFKSLKLSPNGSMVAMCQIDIAKCPQYVLQEKEDDIGAKVPSLMTEMFKCIECPVCMEYMRPPITQCDTGHSICHPCRRKISVCPTCKKQIGDIRNFFLEDFARFVTYPCEHQDYGCHALLPLKDVEAHEVKCKFKPFSCPFAANSRPCSWKHSLSKLVEHVKDEHSRCFIKGQLFWLGRKWKNYTHGITEYDNNIFYVTHRYDGAYYMCSVGLLGLDTDAEKYTFEFEIGADNCNTAIVVKRSCRLAKDYSPFSTHYVKLHKDSFENGVNNQIFSYFRIIKRRDCPENS